MVLIRFNSICLPVQHLGENPQTISEIVAGTHAISKRLRSAQKPVIIVGADQLARKDGAAILSALHTFANTLGKDGWKVFNVLQRTASQVGALDIGYQPNIDSAVAAKPKVLFLLGADANAITREQIPKDCFVVYQGNEEKTTYFCQ